MATDVVDGMEFRAAADLGITVNLGIVIDFGITEDFGVTINDGVTENLGATEDHGFLVHPAASFGGKIGPFFDPATEFTSFNKATMAFAANGVADDEILCADDAVKSDGSASVGDSFGLVSKTK